MRQPTAHDTRRHQFPCSSVANSRINVKQYRARTTVIFPKSVYIKDLCSFNSVNEQCRVSCQSFALKFCAEYHAEPPRKCDARTKIQKDIALKYKRTRSYNEMSSFFGKKYRPPARVISYCPEVVQRVWFTFLKFKNKGKTTHI